MKDRGHNEREIERGREFFERIIHDAGEFGEENVDEIDEEWEEFERVLRCVKLSKNTVSLKMFKNILNYCNCSF